MVQLNSTASPPVLMLLHGMFGQSDNWRSCAVRLARHWRVIAPDLPVLDLPLVTRGCAVLSITWRSFGP